MRKYLDWLMEIVAMVAALIIILVEKSAWAVWDGAKTVVRLARGGVVLAAKTALVVAVIVVLGFSAIPISKAIGGDNFASSAAKWIEGAMYTYKAYRDAGERNEDSTTGTDYTSTSAECWPVTVNTADNSTTVYNGPAILQYAYVNTVLSAHTVLLVDGSTTKLTLPASMAAGSSPNIAGTMFRTSLIVDPDDASTGNITVCFRPLDADSTWTP